jgi:hypothetical protein
MATKPPATPHLYDAAALAIFAVSLRTDPPEKRISGWRCETRSALGSAARARKNRNISLGTRNIVLTLFFFANEYRLDSNQQDDAPAKTEPLSLE